jgi:uncharacterized membrane protein YhaH (DUF805 family)
LLTNNLIAISVNYSKWSPETTKNGVKPKNLTSRKLKIKNMNYYLDVLKNYAKFDGRARRKEYWMFFLFNVIASILFYAIGSVIGIDVLGMLYSLAVLVPGIAVSVRRMHDIGKSGWMVLVGLIPLIGGIWLLILTVTEGESGENEYGADPKQMGEDI